MRIIDVDAHFLQLGNRRHRFLGRHQRHDEGQDQRVYRGIVPDPPYFR